ncbi:TIGR01777 family protein [Flavobacteriaceae bacterium AU392]|nr:TIGR01777 family protein [Flavobacteriaceae bacterium]RKM81206.1 TIGR01777 family protein [Flavobacteriaceae bacterium AU392]
MKILITGATGLIGSEIIQQCHKTNIGVHYLTTRKQKLQSEVNSKGFYWNPKNKEIDITCFEGVDVIINLAGSTIAKRWTKTYKKEILDSRVNGLELLKHTIQQNRIKIKQLISASAIGIYPDSLTNIYTEDYPECSKSFLGQVVEQWERAADTFSELDIVVSKIRIGLVLASNKGALPKIVLPIKIGLGSAFGNGKQWQSWIHVSDLANLFLHVLHYELEGVYNGVAPEAITNSEMTKTIAKTLKKPLLLPNTPKVIMKLILGEMHILLFESQKINSNKIEGKGFVFEYKTLENALENLL